MANWKLIPEPSGVTIERTSWLDSRNFFAVDASGSTAWNSVLDHERDFVNAVRKHPDDQIARWGGSCDTPTKDFKKVHWKSDLGGTTPSNILRGAATLQCIRKSDAWFLLTDGQVYDREVNELAELAMEKDVLNVPVVFVITGTRRSTPESTDISVGISFFANSQDTLILFKEVETGRIYIIAAKGCFAPLASASSRNLSSWRDLAKFKNEKDFFDYCETLDISVPKYEARKNLPSGVNLGPEWEKAHGGPVYVDLDSLLQAGVLSDEDAFHLLAEEAFNSLSVAYKTRRRIADLRPFVAAQKVQQITPQLEDVSGAATIISQMAESGVTPDEKKQLQEQLREAHTRNRKRYQSVLETFSSSVTAQRVRKRNQLVDAALRQLSEIEAAGFTAEILARSSNRARRAAVVSPDTTLSLANLNFDVPSYKGFCLVCCGEQEVMSICLKVLDPADMSANTTDFALNFPLAAGTSPSNLNLISSQNICFQCALLGPSGLSIYKERLAAIIPTLAYEGSNKKYINEQLYLALTTGLKTGASGVSQLFMAILEQTIKIRPWAGAAIEGSNWSVDEQNEAVQRRATFQWMISTMLEHTRCRETFSELGEWVLYPKALEWAARDFEEQGLSSFAITYPVSGFLQLLSFGRKAGAFSEKLNRSMKMVRVLYSVTSIFLARLLKEGSDATAWHQGYLDMVYKEFNAKLVPKDLGGTESLITAPDQFWPHLCTCLSGDLELLANWTAEDKQKVMTRIQVLIFWLIYYQKGHSSAQTFFTNAKHDHPIATAVFNPSIPLPESLAHAILLSPFLGNEDERLIDPEAASLHSGFAPFATPFGPSVLHCAYERCNAIFIPSTEGPLDQLQIEEIRKARAEHLIKAFGIQGRFETNQTGLPEATSTPKPPSSTHYNMHISIARTWATLSRDERQVIVAAGFWSQPMENFVAAVRRNICEGYRGDIFSAAQDRDIREVLPSFFQVLREALRRRGEDGEDVTVYEHQFEENKMELKVRYEMEGLGR